MNLGEEEAVGLGGVELIRAAMRKSAKQLGWKVTTIGWIGTRNGTMIAVQDTREVPDEFRAVVGEAMNDKLRARRSTRSGANRGRRRCSAARCRR
ncbi:hypothetical protein K1Y78_47970 [Streptomyces sp. tea 10]|nr:hypothetical protein [Streptomyces sp. tea 10]